MTVRRLFGAAVLTVLAGAVPAAAQDIFGQGRTPQQVFASDCAICHKSPQGLAKRGGLFGLSSFLREHYMISGQAASAMSKYLEDQGEPAAAPARQPRRATTAKPGEAKPGAKPADVKPSEAKPSDAKAEAKPEAKPEPKSEAKPEAPKLPE